MLSLNCHSTPLHVINQIVFAIDGTLKRFLDIVAVGLFVEDIEQFLQ